MSAGIWDFTIESGATWQQHLLWKDATGAPVPLAGLTARLQIRRNYAAFAADGLVAELTTEDGGIVLTDPGQIDLALSAAATSAIGQLGLTAGQHALEIVDPTVSPSRVTRLVEGRVTISQEVAREAGG